MPIIRDLKGQTFGQLTALALVQNKRYKSSRIWLCECICKKQIEVASIHLTRGIKKTCGCGAATDGRLGRTSHRQSQTPEYRAWINMLKISDDDDQRTRPKEWDDFHAFMKDMGPRPENHRLGTHDTSKPYSKDNNHWTPVKGISNAQALKLKEAAEEFDRAFSGAKDLFKVPDSTPGS